MGMGGMEIGKALLLIALGIGYIVLYLANREEKGLRAAGIIAGVLIMGLSAIMILGKLAMCAKFCKMGGKDMKYHKMMMQEDPAKLDK